MAKVELKAPIVEEISQAIDGAQSAVVVQYLGLTVEQDTALRKELREAGVTYKVYKNTMMKRAFEGTPYADLDEHLNGANALAVSKEDPIAPIRVLAKYAKQYDCFNMVGGIVEGKYADTAALASYADIPTREVLLGRLLGSIQSPITNFARVIKQIAEKDGEAAPAAEAAPEA
ncbi:MAG: 50S ribosomal protein L10 [Lachnospiraceae bacterium]|nr:50S ribosomal protein L10 [Lachnospiraceae bacterium]